MLKPIWKTCTLLLTVLLLAGSARAQFFGYPPAQGSPSQYRDQPYQQQRPQGLPRAQPSRPDSHGQAPAAPPAQTAPAPYDHDLQRLAEILGALHFLRGICGANEGQKWREQAQALIDTEAPAGDRHDQMIAAFNRGYRNFQQSYRTCTPAAVVVIRRYLQEGANLARDVTARYAN